MAKLDTTRPRGAFLPALTDGCSRFRLPLINGGTIAIDRRPGRPASLMLENRGGRQLGVAILPEHDARALVAALQAAFQ